MLSYIKDIQRECYNDELSIIRESVMKVVNKKNRILYGGYDFVDKGDSYQFPIMFYSPNTIDDINDIFDEVKNASPEICESMTAKKVDTLSFIVQVDPKIIPGHTAVIIRYMFERVYNEINPRFTSNGRLNDLLESIRKLTILTSYGKKNIEQWKDTWNNLSINIMKRSGKSTSGGKGVAFGNEIDKANGVVRGNGVNKVNEVDKVNEVVRDNGITFGNGIQENLYIVNNTVEHNCMYVGGYAMSVYRRLFSGRNNDYSFPVSTIDILTWNQRDVVETIKGLLGNDYSHTSLEYGYPDFCYGVTVRIHDKKNHIVAEVYNVENDCLPYNDVNGVRIGSPLLVIKYLFVKIFTSIKRRLKDEIVEKFYDMVVEMIDIMKKDPLGILYTNCYGRYVSPRDIFLKQRDKEKKLGTIFKCSARIDRMK